MLVQVTPNLYEVMHILSLL